MTLEQSNIYLITDNHTIENQLNIISTKLGYALKTFTTGIDFFRNYDKNKNTCTVVDANPIIISSIFLENIKTVTSPFIFLTTSFIYKKI